MNIKYYVKGIEDANSAEQIISEIKEAAGDLEVTYHKKKNLLVLSCAEDTEQDICQRTEELLSSRGIDFERVDFYKRYVRRGKKPMKVSLDFAVCAMIICIVISALTTFAVCKLTEVPNLNDPIYAEVPDYFKNLIKLDQFFREKSYDGYDEDQMAETILDAYIAATGDIYAEYLNAEEFDEYFSERNGEFVGVGVSIVNSEITFNGRKYKVMEIISVFKDSPAIENGVKVGDCIMYVEHEGKMLLVDELGYTKALEIMLGETGSIAKFTVFRPTGDGYEEFDFSIPRRRVESESVTYKVSETDKKVGIISITGFDLTTPPQFKEAVNVLRDVHKCEYFVFDVRNNPGGSLDSIETVLTYFLDERDEIVSTKYADGTTESSKARSKRYSSEYSAFDVKKDEIGMYKDLKCIVLTNENTASAAELFTATLRDYKIADVVGMTTYGKGCMQTLYPLEYMGIEGGLKLTVAMYFSASKTVYHGTGIVPDYKVELSDEAKQINPFLLTEDKDAQMQKAIELLTK